jgi:hypothetical protein
VFFLGLGAFTSLIAHVSNWTWLGYSTSYTLMAIFDQMVGWLLAGLVMARLTPSWKYAK